MKTKHKKLLRKDSRNWSFSSWQTSHCENSERARNFMTSVHFEFQHRRNVTYLMSNRLSCCLLPQMAKAKQKLVPIQFQITTLFVQSHVQSTTQGRTGTAQTVFQLASTSVPCSIDPLGVYVIVWEGLYK